MTDRQLARVAQTGLRLALGTAFLSAVASRLGFWGSLSGGWEPFLKYAAQLNWYLPASLAPVAGVVSTALESVFGLMLIVGWRVRLAAFGSAALLTVFALSMATGENLKSPFDYSVFTAAFAALGLGASDHNAANYHK